MPADTKLGMLWTPERQILYRDADIYIHEGPTNTNPSHDLAHLFIAASSSLPWRPLANDRLTRLAEYNAVFIENMLDKVYSCVVGSIQSQIILPTLLEHARSFVERHYAPFPVPAEEAYRLLCWSIDAPTIVRLSPYFFLQRTMERDDPTFRTRSVQFSFTASDTPMAEGVTFAFKVLVSDIVTRITGGFSEYSGEG